jgi:hypothetical protein
MANAESGSEWFRRDESGLYLLPGTMPWDDVFDVLDKEGLQPDEVVIGNGKLRLLTRAACAGQHEVCARLISMGATMGYQLGLGRAPIAEMVRCRTSGWGSGHRTILRLLAPSVNNQDSEGMTALMFAVRGAGLFGRKQGSLSIVKLLIELGADVSVRDRLGRTALMHAVLSNDKSAASTNDEVVAQMRVYSIEAAAMQAFQRDYQCRFDTDGQFHVERKAMPKDAPPRSAPEPKSRHRAARGDAKVGAIAAKVEAFFGIPEGSVRLVDAKRKPLRSDATIATLRKRHES